uniref:Putative E4 protein n=1 Tax=human papillomavirus 87 TaxID=120381 RepID=A0A7G2A4B0_9PAPI|nr:putative E4 protein [human papillomavirus 87]
MMVKMTKKWNMSAGGIYIYSVLALIHGLRCLDRLATKGYIMNWKAVNGTMLTLQRRQNTMGQKTCGRCMWEAQLFTIHANLYPVLREACQKYPLLQLLQSYTTPPPRPPLPPPRKPPRCRRRLLSDSDSEETAPSSPILHRTSDHSWTVATHGQTITLTTHSGHGTTVSVTVHLSCT